MRFLSVYVVLGLVAGVAASPALAGGEFEQGQVKSLQCVSCHGEQGITSNPMFPHLAGQHASYLEIQLQHFKTGERFHPVMSPIAEVLSRDDIEDLATYYSSLGTTADER